MRSLLLVLALTVPALSQDPTPGKVRWECLADHPGWLGIWADHTPESYLGRLNPFDGTWVFRGQTLEINIREHCYKMNPPKTGSLPMPRVADRPPEKAGVEDDLDRKPPDCGCGSGCECENGRKGSGCTCDDCKCAIVAKPKPKPDNGPKPLFGVDGSKLDKTGAEHFNVSGCPAGRAEVLAALEAGGDIPNDSHLVRLTVIGGEVVRRRVLEDLKTSPHLVYWRNSFVVKGYEPTHWRIKDGGFVIPKDPSQPVIYVQKPDGTVLWRQDHYDGAEDLARTLRDKVPGYDPSKDPSPRPASPLPGLDFNPSWWWAVPALAFLFLLYRWRMQA